MRTRGLTRPPHAVWSTAMRMNIVVVVLLGLTVSTTSRLRAGRADKSGTAGAAHLLIPVGARSIALGGSPLATCSGVEAMYWNPAGLARLRTGEEVMISHTNYFADIGVEYIAAGMTLADIGRIGVAIKSLSVGTIAVTTEDQPDGTGETTSPAFIVVGGTFARYVSDRIAIGMTSNIIYERMASVSATGIAFNVGVQYSGLGGVDGLSVGVAVKNIGPSMRYDGTGLLRTADVDDASFGASVLKVEAAAAEMPSTIEVGLGYSMTVADANVVNVTSMFQNNNFAGDEYKFGGEFVYSNLVSLRGGWTLSPDGDRDGYVFGPSFGAGIRSDMNAFGVEVDYAYRAAKYFGGSHVIGVVLDFR